MKNCPICKSKDIKNDPFYQDMFNCNSCISLLDTDMWWMDGFHNHVMFRGVGIYFVSDQTLRIKNTTQDLNFDIQELFDFIKNKEKYMLLA